MTLLDTNFYSALQIFKGISITTTGGIISLGLVILSVLSMIFDLCTIVKFLFDSTQTKRTANGNPHKIFVNRKEFSQKAVNPLFITRLIIAQYLITLLQSNALIKILSLLGINILYTGYFVYTEVTSKKEENILRKIRTILRIIVEACMAILLATFIFYESDPIYQKYSSAFRQLLEFISMISVMLIVIIQSTIFIITWKLNPVEESANKESKHEPKKYKAP